MSDSPFISANITEYIQKNQIEQNIERCVNEVLEILPENPYTYFTKYFSQKAGGEIIIENLKAFKILGQESYNIVFSVKYRENIFEILSDVQYNLEQENINQNIQIINTEVKSKLKDQDITNQKKIDNILKEFKAQISHQISFSIPRIASKLLNISSNAYLKQIYKNSDQSSYLFINVFQGGKLVNLKQKLYKVYLLIDRKRILNVEQQQQVFEQTVSIFNNLKKIICSGKMGEAALKYHTDGSILCPVDTIADAIKQVEDSIAQLQLQGEHVFKIGISFQADLLYIDSQKKYELENPKQLLDIDQMLDFVVKLCLDKPIIGYVEDPLMSSHIGGMNRLKQKLEGKNVKLGTRKLYESKEQIIQWLEKQERPNSSDPDQQMLYFDYSFIQITQFQHYSDLLEYVQLFTQFKSPVKLVLQDQNNSQGYPYITDYQNLAHIDICLQPPLRQSTLIPFSNMLDQSYLELQ